MTVTAKLDFNPYGDSHIRVHAVGTDSETAWKQVHDIARAINAKQHAGLLSAIPTYDTVLVEFDLQSLLPEEVEQLVRALAAQANASTQHFTPKTFRIPVVYGGEKGPDLPDVAAEQGMSEAEIVAAHSSLVHVIRCLSHHASAMLDGPALPKPVSRRATPRVQVPTGTISIAGKQALMMNCASPSGWQVIGCTPVRLTHVDSDRFVPFEPGDFFSYFAIAENEWDEYSRLDLRDLHD